MNCFVVIGAYVVFLAFDLCLNLLCCLFDCTFWVFAYWFTWLCGLFRLFCCLLGFANLQCEFVI